MRLHQTHRWLVGSFSSLRIFGYSLLNNARRLNPVFRSESIGSAVPAGQFLLADGLSAECRWRFSGTLEPFTEFAGCVNAPTLDSAVRIFRGDQHLSSVLLIFAWSNRGLDVSPGACRHSRLHTSSVSYFARLLEAPSAELSIFRPTSLLRYASVGAEDVIQG